MKLDEFDNLVSDERITENEWKAFATILKIKDIENKNCQERCLAVNKEFRHYFGNTVANMARNEYEPDYEVILEATRVFLGVEDDFPSEASILKKEDIICKNIVGEETINEKSYEAFVERITKISDSRAESVLQRILNGLKDGLTRGGAVVLIGRILSIVKIARIATPVGCASILAGVVNQVLFETKWEIVLSIIMLTYSIRKRLEILDAISVANDN